MNESSAVWPGRARGGSTAPSFSAEREGGPRSVRGEHRINQMAAGVVGVAADEDRFAGE